VTLSGPNDERDSIAPAPRGEPGASRVSRSAARPFELALAHRGGPAELLRAPELAFRAVVLVRRALYDRGWWPSRRAGVPVISVGNLSTGGTGKTPFCAWLVRELSARGVRPGLLSRGYGGENGARNDEALLLERSCPGVPHVQDPDRVRGARELERLGVEAIVLDDGFQHRRLARDLDLVLVDATRPWGLPPPRDGSRRANEPMCALLPRGLLREPRSSLARADAIVITRADQVDAESLLALERAIERSALGRPIARAEHRAIRIVDERGSASNSSLLAEREVDLVSAIGNPEAFEESVRATGAIVREHRVFPDHHRYARADVDGLGADGRPLVTTAKDAVKLERFGVAFLALEIEIEIVRGGSALQALFDAVLRARAENAYARTRDIGVHELANRSGVDPVRSPRGAERTSERFASESGAPRAPRHRKAADV
jgi:tetraacyldisaccharide 4'-kinase